MHCYAETLANRWGYAWGPKAPRRFFGDAHWREPLKWNRKAEAAGERHRVFCASMGDICEDRRDLDEPRARLQQLIFDTPHLDWILLTKRPENYDRFFSPEMLRRCRCGATAGTQASLDRIYVPLARTPSWFRWISMEPLLEAVNPSMAVFNRERAIRRAMNGRAAMNWDQADAAIDYPVHGIVIGAESGPGARPCRLQWIGDIVGQCDDANVKVHVKQLQIGSDGCDLECCKPRLSRDPREWPAHLRRRDW